MPNNTHQLMNSADWICLEDLATLAAACEPSRPNERSLRQLLLAIPPQLSALLEIGRISQDVANLVLNIQKRKSVLIDPRDNWFTRNLPRFGGGFDLRSLTADPSLMASKFDSLAPHWEEYVTGCHYREVFLWLAQNAISLPQSLRKAGRFLDLACGVGLMGQTLRLTDVEGHLTGVDLSSGMLAKANARGCYNELIQADINKELSVPEQSIDIGICIGALELLDVDAVLQQCRRVVKLGGTLWVSFQHNDGVSPNPTEHQHIVGLTEEDIVCRLDRWGFQAVSIERCPVAFVTPSGQGKLQAVPYLFVRAERCS